MTINKKKY